MPSSRPKVLLVTPDYPPRVGGIQVLMERLVANAPGLRFRVLTLGAEGAAAFDAAADGEVRRVGSADGDRRVAGALLNAASIREVVRWRPDAILSGHIIGSLGAVAMRRALRVPFVQYVHADELRARRGLAQRAVGAADLTIAVSGYTRDLVLSIGGDPARVRVIHPGVDLPSTVEREPAAQPTLVTVARIHYRYKGHDVMVRAMPLIRARVPGARWVVIGDGKFAPAVEAMVAAYGLEDAVDLLGRVDDAERDAWLRRANVFAMPSRVPPGGVGGEGFGIAYMEAAARGVAAIGGNVTGARDAIRDGETGLLVDPGDHLAVAEAAISLLGDPERAARMGAAAREWAELHAWPLIGAEIEGAVLEVIAASATRYRRR
jgi:phosphatidylinositol alpha-1,6-mannosyltransferase